MRTNIEIDDALMKKRGRLRGFRDQEADGGAGPSVDDQLRKQQEVGEAFGKYRWRGNLARSRRGRGAVIVVDSSVWIDFLNGRNVPHVRRLRAALGDSRNRRRRLDALRNPARPR